MCVDVCTCVFVDVYMHPTPLTCFAFVLPPICPCHQYNLYAGDGYYIVLAHSTYAPEPYIQDYQLGGPFSVTCECARLLRL